MIAYHGSTVQIQHPDIKHIDTIYRQNLENDIICYLAEICGREIREMADVYFSSKLAEQIEQGLYGIDNMDYKYLANDLIENEPELFYNKFSKEQEAT